MICTPLRDKPAPSRARPKPQDLAIFNLSSKTYHTTALVMTILVRSTRPDGSPTWLMRAVGEGTEAKVAKQCLDEIQLVLTGAKKSRELADDPPAANDGDRPD